MKHPMSRVLFSFFTTEMREMIIAVDFDGTIVEHRYPDIGKPKLFAFECLKQLEKDGHKLILWTFRSGAQLDEAVKFCKAQGLKFYAVNSSYPGEKFDPDGASRKIAADLFIDDRNFGGFPGWDAIWENLGNRPEATAHIAEDKIQNDNIIRRFIRYFGFGKQ